MPGIGNPSPAQQGDRVTECADQLADVPTNSSTIPSECTDEADNSNGNGFYSYYHNGQTYYLLPSRAMVLSNRSETYSSAKTNEDQNKRFELVIAGIFSAVAFVAITDARRHRIRSEQSKKTGAVAAK